MPTKPTYPGVYVEEIPSGVRTIVGVSTSDTAFIDFFPRGPANTATRITSFSDFERIFGGLDRRSEASYALMQYYLNGGQIAWVVRVTDKMNMETASRALPGAYGIDGLIVKASSPGDWGNYLQVGVDYKTSSQSTFNLVVREVRQVGRKRQVIASQIYRNLSIDKASSNYAVEVVNSNSSSLIKLEDGVKPTATHDDAIAALNKTEPNGGNPDRERQFLKLKDGSDGDVLDDEGNLQQNKSDEFSQALKKGIFALERIAPYIFNLLCIPAITKFDSPEYKIIADAAIAFCIEKRAFMLLDIPKDQARDRIVAWLDDSVTKETNAAVYFPRLEIPDPLNDNRPRNVGASGTVAGVYARTDATRGIWKAPAGIDATLRGVNLTEKLTDLENGDLNILGINALRNFPIYGNVSWGARTLEGADQLASEWKYVPVRRMALYIEESLFQGLKWVVFEPNDEPLWSQIRLNVGAFMQNLFRQGAFQGSSPRDAYLVKCDKETTTQNDINLGIVNIVVGFAPLKPAEFVIIKIQQLAGQIEV